MEKKKSYRLLRQIYAIIDQSEPIDLLAKLSYLKWLIMTDAFIEVDQRSIQFVSIKDTLYFVTSYLFTHSRNSENKLKITFDKLNSLLDKVWLFWKLSYSDDHSNDDLTNKLNYAQNDSGELLPYFEYAPFGHILSCEDDLLQSKFGCTAYDIWCDYNNIKKSFLTSVTFKGITIEEFISNFDKYCGCTAFSFPSTARSYKFLSAISCSIGEIPEDEFSPYSPLSLIKKNRKILLKNNGSIYCFDLEMFCNLLIRCAERSLQEDKKQNHNWDENMKNRTEGLVKELFVHYFKKDGVYHQNLTFKNADGVGESDGIFEYLNYLFVIEIKSGKISPDPVTSDSTTVHSSYNRIIGTAEHQCEKVREHIVKFGGVFKDGAKSLTLKYDSSKIIKVVVSFEDLSAVLPDENIQNLSHAILLSYYDLLIIFDFIQNPLLLLKYFVERTQKISIQAKICDEMIYLGIFRDDINMSSKIDGTEMAELDGRPNLYMFDPHTITNDIEMHYTDHRFAKPKIKLTDFQSLVVRAFINSAENRIELSSLLLDLPAGFGDELMKEYLRKRDYDPYYQAICGGKHPDGRFISVMISKRHKGDERFCHYAFAKKIFACHPETVEIISLIDDKNPYAEIITPGQKELYYKKTIEMFEKKFQLRF